jgi:hypothetical protein
VVASVVLVFCAASHSTAEIADGYIDRIVRAYGGPEALEKMTAYRVVAATDALLRGSIKGTVVRDVRAPASLRVTIEYPDGPEVRILDGARGWRGTGGDLAPAEGMLLESMVYQLLRSDLPGSLARYEDRLVDGGLSQGEDGAAYRVLVLPVTDTLEVRYWIDAASLRVTRVTGTIRAGDMTIAFATEYADFRQVDGVWVPFREINYAGGRKVAETTVRTIVWAPEDLGPFVAD